VIIAWERPQWLEVVVDVMPKPRSSPPGQAWPKRCPCLVFEGVTKVRQGNGSSWSRTLVDAGELARIASSLLATPSSRVFTYGGRRMRIGVITFPGTLTTRSARAVR